VRFGTVSINQVTYLCCLLHDWFLPTKRHSSDVWPSYILIFSSFQLVVYPAGQSTYQSLFTGIIVYNYKDFCQIVPKFDTYIYLWLPTCVPNFSWIEACIPKLEQFLCLCEKKKKLKLWSLVFQKWLAWFPSNLECSLPL